MPIYERLKPGTKKKQWRAVVSYTTTLGEHKKATSKWFDLKAEAQQAEADLRSENCRTATLGRTFSEVCLEYIADSKASNTPKTIREKKELLKDYLGPLADKRLEKITPFVLQELFRQENFDHLGSSRKNKIRGLVSSTYKYAMRIYGYPSNPCDGVPTFKKSDTEKMRQKVVYTPDMVKRLLEAIDPRHEEVARLLRVLYMSGARLNEILSCTFADWDGQSLHLWHQVMEGEWRPLKTTNSARFVQLDKKSNALIQAQFDYYRDLPGFDSSWFIFGGPKIYHNNSVRNVVNRAQEAAGLPHCRLHDFRHAHASVLLENMHGDGDILKVSKRLGHSSVSITLDVYSHILAKNEDAVVSVLDGLL